MIDSEGRGHCHWPLATHCHATLPPNGQDPTLLARLLSMTLCKCSDLSGHENGYTCLEGVALCSAPHTWNAPTLPPGTLLMLFSVEPLMLAPPFVDIRPNVGACGTPRRAVRPRNQKRLAPGTRKRIPYFGKKIARRRQASRKIGTIRILRSNLSLTESVRLEWYLKFVPLNTKHV